MFLEALNSYELCCKRYAESYPDVVGNANLQNLTAVGGSLRSLNSICAVIARNAASRASTLSKMLSGRNKSIDELLSDVDAELGCDASHGFAPINPPAKEPSRGTDCSQTFNPPSSPRSKNTKSRNDLNPSYMPTPCRTPYAPTPSYSKKPANQESSQYSPVEETRIESERSPLRAPAMPVRKNLDNASIALDKQYGENFVLYKNTLVKLVNSCDEILVQHDGVAVDLKSAQDIARELDSWMRRPVLDADVIRKRIEVRETLIRRLKDARTKIENISQRFRQRQTLHCMDIDVCKLDNIITQYQQTFGKKRWFVDFRNKLETFKSFLGCADARVVATQLERLNSNLDSIARTLKAVAMRINSDISTEKERRASIDAAQERLDIVLRNAKLHYQRMLPKGKLVFQTVSFQSGTIVKPTLEELRKDVAGAFALLWRQLSTVCQQVSNLQKDILNLSTLDLNKTKAFPAYIIIGGVRVQCGTSAVVVPVLTSFPFVKPRLFQDGEQISSFLMRVLYALPMGGIRLNIIDHAAVGAHARDFNQLLGLADDMVKIITIQDDIRGMLQEILAYMGDLAKTKFTGTIARWSEYNKKNPTALLPCTILVIYSFKGWECREFELLEPILERGAQCGVFVVGLMDGLAGLDERLRKIIRLDSFAIMPPSLAKNGFAYKKLSASWQPIGKLHPNQWDNLIVAYKDAYEVQVSRTSHTFVDLYSDVVFWSCNSTDGLDAVIGWDASDIPQHFRLGFGNEGLNHVLMGGRNGSGKTNLIHVIIRSLCYRYSPEELALYLLDFKNGVEFFRYSDKGQSWLPHARTISAHNDPNYALAMLESLVAEMERRNNIFKASGVVGLEEYRRKTHQKMARILIIVDEFIVMFSSDDSVDRIADLTAALLNRGRSAGIHLLLATQTVASFSVRGAEAMFQQLAVRLALPGNGSEGFLDGANHSEVRSIRIPQCIYNDNAGAPGCNHVFVHPQFIIEDQSSVDYRYKMEAGVEQLGGWSKFPCRVFNGFGLSQMPSNDQFGAWLGASLRDGRRHFELVLGIHSDFVGNVCKATFDDEAAEDHLLIVYEKDDLDAAKGLLASILKSLEVLPDKAVLLYDPEQTQTLCLPSSGFDVANANTERGKLLGKLKALRDSKASHKVLIVENFVSARCLHQKKSSPLGWDDDNAQTKESTDSLFKSAFEDSDKVPFHVICFTRRARSAMEKLGNPILGKFSKRIAFSLNSADLEELIPQARGMDVHDKVLFSDEASDNGVVSILPYHPSLKAQDYEAN